MSDPTGIFKNLLCDTKKLGRLVALVVILGIAGAISIIMVWGGDNGQILDHWIDLAKIAVMFYFMKTMDDKIDKPNIHPRHPERPEQ